MQVDALVIGGGIFGCHAAHYLAEQGLEVLLVEQEKELIQRASVVNQARLHAGYHYPRSIATALASDHYIERFRADFSACINGDFVHYYAIARRGSLTDAAQFEHFCRYLGLACEIVEKHPAFCYDQLEAVFAAKEDSFDPLLLAAHYRALVSAHPRIRLYCYSRLEAARQVDQNYVVQLRDGWSGILQQLRCSLVVNATYSSINSIHRLFDQPLLPLQHEIAEMAFVRPVASFARAALTVMDGPFCSLMPYGKSGLHSLSSVAYTHQRVSYEAEPNFGCMEQEATCSPSATANCSHCASQPTSNYPKMLAQLRRYLQPSIGLDYLHSRFIIKAKLQANHIDDGRPTEVLEFGQVPAFFSIFAGKVNNVYAVEEALDRAINWNAANQ